MPLTKPATNSRPALKKGANAPFLLSQQMEQTNFPTSEAAISHPSR